MESHVSSNLGQKSLASEAKSGIRTKIRILILFAGRRRRGSVRWWLEDFAKRLKVAIEVMDLDIEIDVKHNLIDDANWRPLMEDLDHEGFDAIFMCPPCSTFGCRRNDGGPMPLRGTGPKDIYGLEGLSEEDSEKVKIGTACATNCADCAIRATRCSVPVPWLLEQPRELEDKPHLLELPEWIKVLEEAEPNRSTVPQCCYESVFEKLTDLVGTVDLDGMPGSCPLHAGNFRACHQGQRCPPNR